MDEVLKMISQYQAGSANVSAALQIEGNSRCQQKFLTYLLRNAAILRDLHDLAANAAHAEVFI